MPGAVELGLLYALMALGVYITFRILDFPDLIADEPAALHIALEFSQRVGRHRLAFGHTDMHEHAGFGVLVRIKGNKAHEGVLRLLV